VCMCVCVWWETEVQNRSLGLTGKYSVGAQETVFLLYSVRNTSTAPSQSSQTLQRGARCTLLA
jgi:hypothetical protein